MTNKGKRCLYIGLILTALFIIWTSLLLFIDTQPAGQTGAEIGFSTINTRFHRLTGVHMQLYTVTDWLGLVPIAVCLVFSFVGLTQAIKRKSLLKVDSDILLLGLYYLLVIFTYLFFEMHPVNYRPILIGSRAEASYPSSTVLLVACVMPTLVFQARIRLRNARIKNTICTLTIVFSLFTIVGRLVSGVHWLSDIVGALLFSSGLFCIYKALVILYCKGYKNTGEGPEWNFTKNCRN